MPRPGIGDILLCTSTSYPNRPVDVGVRAGRLYTVSAYVCLDPHAAQSLIRQGFGGLPLIEVRETIGNFGMHRFLPLSGPQPEPVVALANAILDVRTNARRPATPADLEAKGFGPGAIIEYGVEAAQLAVSAIALMPQKAA